MPMEFESVRSRERGMSLPHPEMAFEHFAEKHLEEKLWRVSWERRWTSSKGIERKVNCVDYFASADEAWQFVRRQTDEGNDVRRVDTFAIMPTDRQPNEDKT